VNEYDEFRNKRNINGHSLTMRLYFWKAALHVIKAHPVFGVGTGDVQNAINEAYEETGSPLNITWRKRPHNQFITITVALGITGLIIFLFALFYPPIRYRKWIPALYWPFFIIAVLSFLTEDTLETQAGLTFFAVFNSLFISAAWFRSSEDQKENSEK
jgi:O-antigen ligase